MTADVEKTEILNNFLPQFSLTIALSIFLESLNLKAGAGDLSHLL